MMMMMMIISVTFNRSSRFVFNWILLPRSQVTGSQDLDTFSSLGWAVCCLSSSSLHTLFVCCFFIFFYFIYTYIFLWAFPLCYFKARTGKWGGETGKHPALRLVFKRGRWTLPKRCTFWKFGTKGLDRRRTWKMDVFDRALTRSRALHGRLRWTQSQHVWGGGKRLSVRIVLPKMFKR